jgi:putative Mg2+ transporter-C (MgtC) family protein
MSALVNSVFAPGILVKLITAIILSGLIGIEREIHGRPAGLRTHILVCLGTTVIIISGSQLAYLFSEVSYVGTITMDPGRIAAGIITGIGFIGGGCIIRIGDYVRGLTTAACLWFVAALGIVVGIGLYTLAVTVTVLALIVLMLFEKIEDYLPKFHYRKLHLTYPLDKASDIEHRCNRMFDELRIQVLRVKHHMNRSKDTAEASYFLRVKDKSVMNDILKTCSRDETIRTIKLV